MPPARLTPARWGDRLWPVIRAELDVVRTLPPASQLAVSNSYRTADGAGDVDFVLTVTAGEGNPPERPDRGWTRAAERYLAGG